jgi:hypothetical protein
LGEAATSNKFAGHHYYYYPPFPSSPVYLREREREKSTLRLIYPRHVVFHPEEHEKRNQKNQTPTTTTNSPGGKQPTYKSITQDQEEPANYIEKIKIQT